MFIELTTTKGEKITFNTENIVFLSSNKNKTLIVDVNGIDWMVVESYESLKGVLQTFDFDKTYTTV